MKAIDPGATITRNIITNTMGTPDTMGAITAAGTTGTTHAIITGDITAAIIRGTIITPIITDIIGAIITDTITITPGQYTAGTVCLFRSSIRPSVSGSRWVVGTDDYVKR